VLSAIIAPNPKCYDVNYVGTSVIAQLSNIMLLCVCIYIYIYIERERYIIIILILMILAIQILKNG
jgi:hypothetical protein